MLDITKIKAEFDKLTKESEAYVTASFEKDQSAEDEAAQTARFARLEKLAKMVEQYNQHVKIAGVEFEKASSKVVKSTDAAQAEFEKAEINVSDAKFDAKSFGKELASWASTGAMAKFATITSASGSGILVPTEVLVPLVATEANTFRAAMALQGVNPIQSNTTSNMNWPVIDPSAGGVVAENASSETENAPGLTHSVTLDADTYQSGSIWFSNQVLAANDFDLVPVINDTLVYNKELGLEKAIADAIIADSGVTQINLAAVDKVYTSDNSYLSYRMLVDLNRALSKVYDKRKVIILSQTAYEEAEKLTGSDGHPVLNRDPQNQELLKFNGTPVLRSDYFSSDFSVGQTVGCIVSMIGFRIRDCAGQVLARYTQTPNKPNQTGFNLFGYHGFGYSDNAVAKIVLI